MNLFERTLHTHTHGIFSCCLFGCVCLEWNSKVELIVCGRVSQKISGIHQITLFSMDCLCVSIRWRRWQKLKIFSEIASCCDNTLLFCRSFSQFASNERQTSNLQWMHAHTSTRMVFARNLQTLYTNCFWLCASELLSKSLGVCHTNLMCSQQNSCVLPIEPLVCS